MMILTCACGAIEAEDIASIRVIYLRDTGPNDGLKELGRALRGCGEVHDTSLWCVLFARKRRNTFSAVASKQIWESSIE